MLVPLLASRVVHALAFGALLQSQGVQIPAPRGFVNDFANVIPAEQEARIERIAEDVRAKSGGDITVVTLPNLGGRDVADVAREIGRQWGVGRKGNPGDPARNTGVVILFVPRETGGEGRSRVRIETGYGAEGFITDATSGAILDEAAPYAQSGDYGTALQLVTQRVAERFAREFNFTLSRGKVKPGLAIVQLANQGEDPHDLAIKRIGGKRRGTIAKTLPGELGEWEGRLRRGRYRLYCTIEGHRAAGMRAVLRVR